MAFYSTRDSSNSCTNNNHFERTLSGILVDSHDCREWPLTGTREYLSGGSVGGRGLSCGGEDRGTLNADTTQPEASEKNKAPVLSTHITAIHPIYIHLSLKLYLPLTRILPTRNRHSPLRNFTH